MIDTVSMYDLKLIPTTIFAKPCSLIKSLLRNKNTLIFLNKSLHLQ